jgi:hypothetical protein
VRQSGSVFAGWCIEDYERVRVETVGLVVAVFAERDRGFQGLAPVARLVETLDQVGQLRLGIIELVELATSVGTQQKVSSTKRPSAHRAGQHKVKAGFNWLKPAQSGNAVRDY